MIGVTFTYRKLRFYYLPWFIFIFIFTNILILSLFYRILLFAGTIVQANFDSIAYAVLELGGNLNAKYQGSLIDGSTTNVWPIVGYNYFILRLNSHIGSCERRQAAMHILYDFYSSSTVLAIAKRYGYAPLPNFVADIIANMLVNKVKCSDGNFLFIYIYKFEY